MTKSGIIQICFAAALKGTRQLNGTRQGYSFYGFFNLCSPKFLLLFHAVQNWAIESWQGCRQPQCQSNTIKAQVSRLHVQREGRHIAELKGAFSEHLEEVQGVVYLV